jgi:hypothetical protein
MNFDNWNQIAAFTALFTRVNPFIPPRSSLVVETRDEEVVAVAVYGNDGYDSSERARLEVELVRQRFPELGLEETGFGLSPDGHTWVLLVHPVEETYRTKVGQTFQLELVRVALDDLVQRAWLDAGYVHASAPLG